MSWHWCGHSGLNNLECSMENLDIDSWSKPGYSGKGMNIGDNKTPNVPHFEVPFKRYFIFQANYEHLEIGTNAIIASQLALDFSESLLK
jgi:hypothetical protein